MIREFQVVYREPKVEIRTDSLGAISTLVGLNTFDEPKTINVQMADDAAARQVFEAEGFKVLGVTEVRPVVDWSKPVWNLDEFAAALGMKPGSLSAKKGDGMIPWSKKYGGVPREIALRCIEESLNDCGKQIARELRHKNS